MPKGKQNPESLLAQLIAQLGLSVVEYLINKKKTEARAKLIQAGRAKAKQAKPKQAVAKAATPKVRKARAASVATTGAASESTE